MELKMKNLSLDKLRGKGLTDDQRRMLMISGIVVSAAALLAYPAMLLYRRWRQRQSTNETPSEDHQVKSFAPSYLGHHKPHHRKAASDGHLQQTQA